jgi:hypothetical protein
MHFEAQLARFSRDAELRDALTTVIQLAEPESASIALFLAQAGVPVPVDRAGPNGNLWD